MTLFLRTQIPDEIQTIEQLHIWTSEILNNLYPNLNCVEQINPETGENIKAVRIEGNKYYYTAPEIPTWRYLSRASIDISSDHQRFGKIWEHARDFGGSAIPPEMRKVT